MPRATLMVKANDIKSAALHLELPAENVLVKWADSFRVFRIDFEVNYAWHT